MEPSEKQRAAREGLMVPCPRCGAVPREPCRNAHGEPVLSIHIGRLREAKVGVRLYSLKEARKTRPTSDER
jgi:hypothetical protein